MDSAIKELVNYGALGAMVVVLSLFIMWLIKRQDAALKDTRDAHLTAIESHEETVKEIVGRHEKEREIWRAEFSGQFTNVLKVIERNSNVIAEHTETLKSRFPR